MIAFVNVLSQRTQRIVVDRTGLTGLFEADLTWQPEAASPGVPGLPGAVENPAGDDTSKPPLVTALQQQLGLKLESRKEVVDVLVIDRIDHPDEN